MNTQSQTRWRRLSPPLRLAARTPPSAPTKPRRSAPSLTPIGAEKAANKDGTIPAYTGGLTTPPAGYKAGDGIRPNPFASEKPRLVDRRQEHGAACRPT